MFPNLGRPSEALVSYDKSLRLLGEVTHAQPESSAIVHDWITVSLKRSDLLLTLGRPREAMDEAMDNRRRILSELQRRPGDLTLEDDLCVNYSHVITMKRAAADTAGAIQDCTAYLALVESLFRTQPEFDLEIFRGDFFPANLVGTLKNLVHACGFKAELEFPFGDPRHIQQIIDEARFQFHVAPDDFQGPAHFR